MTPLDARRDEAAEKGSFEYYNNPDELGTIHDAYETGFKAGYDLAQAKAEEREKRLVEALEFYANKKNWDDRYIEEGDQDSGGDIYDVIDRSDVDTATKDDLQGFDETWIGHWTIGGKKARDALAAHRERKDEA